MTGDLGCNCTHWFKLPSSWPTSNLPRHPALKTGAQACACGRKKEMFTHSFCSFVGHNVQCNLISFSRHNILKRRDNRQHEIHVSESRIRRQLIPFISCPLIPPCLCLPPPLFLAAQIIDQPPSVWGSRALEAQQRGRKFHWSWTKQPHQYCPSRTPSAAFLSRSLLPQSLGCNSLTRVLYLMTYESN